MSETMNETMNETKLNLIPDELKISRKTLKLIAVLKIITLWGSIFLLLLLIIIVSLNFYYLSQSNKIMLSVDGLKARITSLEKNEQKLILTKDKMSKLEIINNKPSVTTEIAKTNELTQSLGDSVTIKGFKLVPQMIEMSFAVSSVNQLDIFLEKIKSVTGYKLINMSLLDFKPESGISVSLVFSNK